MNHDAAEHRYYEPSPPPPLYPAHIPSFLPHSTRRYQPPEQGYHSLCADPPHASQNSHTSASSYRFPDNEQSHGFTETVSTTSGTHSALAHPYARIFAKKGTPKRHRKIWNHALEKSLFSAHELYVFRLSHVPRSGD